MLAVTRELKLALIVGFSLVLVVWVLITDHVKKSSASDGLAPMRGDDPSRLTAVGNQSGDPFVPHVQLQEPEPKSNKLPDPKGSGVTHIDQSGRNEGGKLGTSPLEPLPEAPGALRPTTTPDKPYVVVSGDTLYNICKKQYGDASLHTKLAEYNKLADGKGLKLDQKLVLPAKEVLEGKAAPYQTKAAATPAAPAGGSGSRPLIEGPLSTTMMTSYEVASGDTLSSIAKSKNIPVSKVVELNPGLKGREGQLKVGEKLTLPK